MTTELLAGLIGAVILLISNTAAAIKLWTEMQKQKADRAETKVQRDADSAKLQEATQKNTWELARLKEDVQFLRTTQDDHQMQLSVLNTELAKVSTKLDSALDILHDLKEAQK